MLKEGRADYGDEILPTLSAKLVPRHGRGPRARNLASTTHFAKIFPDDTIVAALSQQLSWSHSVELSSSNNPMILVQVSHIWRGSIAYTFMPESATSRRSKADMREPRGGN